MENGYKFKCETCGNPMVKAGKNSTGKESNCEKYGMLYERYEALVVCPIGWHLPSKAEWDALLSQVGSDAGKKLKATSEDWRDGAGTDDYGFGALPGGQLANEFKDINITGYWWTASDNNNSYSYKVEIGGNNVRIPSFSGANTNRLDQVSVRCVLGSSSSSSITYGELVDERDEQKYRTVKIGTQNWMAENLNYEKEGSPCYNYKENNCEIFGRMYDWETAKTICPEGWKLPTKSDWDALLSYVGDLKARKLKARSDIWGDGYGLDYYGFGALPGGQLANEFKDVNITGYWWTATANSNSYSYKVEMGKGNDVRIPSVSGANTNRTNQVSVRCIEDL